MQDVFPESRASSPAGGTSSFKYSLIYFIKTVVLSSVKFSGGAFMLRKVVKVQKFPPDRPCDSLTAEGGKKKICRQKKKTLQACYFF